MIFGIGNDLTDCARIAEACRRHGTQFLEHVLTPAELALSRSFRDPTEFIAGRWAAKEAFSKALGTGIGADCSFTDIEILPDLRGKPQITLRGTTRDTASRLGISKIHLSISHERTLASAVVLLESDSPETSE